MVLISVIVCVDLRDAECGQKGEVMWIFPRTPPGLEPGIFLLVAQCLNELRHCSCRRREIPFHFTLQNRNNPISRQLPANSFKRVITAHRLLISYSVTSYWWLRILSNHSFRYFLYVTCKLTRKIHRVSLTWVPFMRDLWWTVDSEAGFFSSALKFPYQSLFHG
jgi:hypothetical protein